MELTGVRTVFLLISCRIGKNLFDNRLRTAGQGHGGQTRHNDEAARYQLLARKFLISKPLEAGRALRGGIVRNGLSGYKVPGSLPPWSNSPAPYSIYFGTEVNLVLSYREQNEWTFSYRFDNWHFCLFTTACIYYKIVH